jgi:hypothetical protein
MLRSLLASLFVVALLLLGTVGCGSGNYSDEQPRTTAKPDPQFSPAGVGNPGGNLKRSGTAPKPSGQ